MLAKQFILGTSMILGNVVFHVGMLLLLVKQLRRHEPDPDHPRSLARMFFYLTYAVLIIICIHIAEAASWALVYYAFGEFSDFPSSLYFSMVTATTLGYGDMTLSESKRLLSTFEAVGGLILFSTSTAFLIELMRRIFDDPSKAEA
ncbi:Two pore domain potassium channel family protein [Sulfidibacter corallicola]|uniref:Two pore domain potassium channel family protein n=1 Tax=Sulfidibacter corallicola TaxID=2818388 RepID=A0A8A4TJF1_SULCO|nr:potassium channel family protein [Sulfidibacter corallicola]QTD48971.1 two pore domain potassium channel family protein [Sulfidibacter corallicola]